MKKDLERYFDDPATPLQDEESIEIAMLMEEICELETPDPGSDYWNSFNSRLQTRLNHEKPVKRFSWFKLMAPLATLAILAAIAFILIPRSAPIEQELDQFDALADLSTDELSLLAGVHALNPYELQSSDEMVQGLDNELIEDLYYNPNDMYQNLDSIDHQMLQSLFNEEG